MFHYSAYRRKNHSLILVEEVVKLFWCNYWQNAQITAAVHYFQSKPPEVFYKKSCSFKVRKYQTKIPMLGSVFNKVPGLRACNFITSKLQHSCFLVKFAKFSRISILKNIGKRLLLYIHYNSHHHFHNHHFHYHQEEGGERRVLQMFQKKRRT